MHCEEEIEIQFVDEKIEQECSCPVCLSVFKQGSALQFSCCGCHVCSKCHLRLQNARGNCPMCRQQNFVATEDKYFEQHLVRSSQVYCSNKSKGCDWQGELRDLPNHVINCPKSDKQCELCSKIMPFKSLKIHTSSCDGILIDCPNMCKSMKVKRKDMQDHLENKCSQRIDAISKHCSIPFIFTLTNFSNIINNRAAKSSPPFYTAHNNGYKIILRFSAQNGFLSVILCLLQGENDHELQWPIVGTLDVELINWRDSKQNFSSEFFLAGDAACQAPAKSESSSLGIGNIEFIPLASLAYNEKTNSEFLKYDSVIFSVKQIHYRLLPVIPQLPRIWTNTSMCTFTVPFCTELKNNNCDYFGPPFYTSPEGYKLCIRVCLAGKGRGKGTHVSVYAHIMRGQNDGKLDWPFHADINISLLNWKANSNHISKVIRFNYTADDIFTKRVMSNSNILCNGWGLDQFCEGSLFNLRNARAVNIQFLKDDCLIFKIDSVTTYPCPPHPNAHVVNGKDVVPYEFTVTAFSKRRQHNSSFYTKPFYTHDKGYKLQMCISTDESMLSCRAFLLKGENDKNLEWPFRADIVVQLVNRKDRRKNFSKIISFTSDLPTTLCNPPVAENIGTADFGLPDFMLLSDLSPEYVYAGSITLAIPILHVYSNGLIKKVPKWQGGQYQYLEFNITGYTKHKQLGTRYLSPPFYTHRNGYKMRLEVDFPHKDGNKNIKLSTRLLKGEYDTTLQWPFTGNLLIELINWRQDKNHYDYNMGFHKRILNSANSIVTHGNAAKSCFTSDKCITEDELCRNNVEYIQEDCLRLRIKKIAVYSRAVEKQPYWQFRSPLRNFEFTLDDFPKRIAVNNCFFSPPFYSSPQGYKMCLKVFSNGLDEAKNSHVSVFVCILQGEYDDFLQWPFEGDVVIEVINWREDRNHFRRVISLNRHVPESLRQRSNEYIQNPTGWGFPKFINHTMFFSQGQGNSNQHAIYVEENNYVRFAVRAVTNYNTPLLSKSPHWKGWLNSSRNVCEFTLTGYSLHMEYGSIRHSPDFYTHKNGYKLRLEISPNDAGTLKSGNLSVFIRLLKGEFDDSLKWPMNVDVPIEIANWRKNSSHLRKVVKFGNASPNYVSRVQTSNAANGSWGFHDFCSLTTLTNCTRDIQYVDEDCLHFCVKQPTIHSKNGFFV